MDSILTTNSRKATWPVRAGSGAGRARLPQAPNVPTPGAVNGGGGHDTRQPGVARLHLDDFLQQLSTTPMMEAGLLTAAPQDFEVSALGVGDRGQQAGEQSVVDALFSTPRQRPCFSSRPRAGLVTAAASTCRRFAGARGWLASRSSLQSRRRNTTCTASWAWGMMRG
jgi:hypothetical protein